MLIILVCTKCIILYFWDLWLVFIFLQMTAGHTAWSVRHLEELETQRRAWGLGQDELSISQLQFLLSPCACPWSLSLDLGTEVSNERYYALLKMTVCRDWKIWLEHISTHANVQIHYSNTDFSHSDYDLQYVVVLDNRTEFPTRIDRSIQEINFSHR